MRKVREKHIELVVVLDRAMERIRGASAHGIAVRLTAAEVRALDYAIVRDPCDIDVDNWKTEPFSAERHYLGSDA